MQVDKAGEKNNDGEIFSPEKNNKYNCYLAFASICEYK